MSSTLAKKTASPEKRAAGRVPANKHAAWTLRHAGRLQILEATALARLDWLVHGFSTRFGGVSELAASIPAKTQGSGKSPEQVLNLGFTDWDSRECVRENRKSFFRALGSGEMRCVTLRQIHSDVVHRVSSSPAEAQNTSQGDALFTREHGVLLAVQTADCVPILLADTKRRAIAAVHAGWRGTLGRIAEKTLGRMQMEFGTRPEDVIAALGPGIGRCCYEVGPEVAVEFHAQFTKARDWFDGPFDALASDENDPNWLPWLTMMPPGHQPPPLRVHLDLIAANRAILAGAGVPQAQILSSGFCTACRTELFFSYRRERTTGRMMAAIGIRND
ncbi:MAG TPA: peptidoglycan editing factor PgeF [Candidatus Acidoferrales bacterium]|nr:peptidoglycan editing factor PgeF [Candidatus Acidoferrales bacterium]